MRWGRLTSCYASKLRSGPLRRASSIALTAIGILGSGARLHAQAASGAISGRVTDAVAGTPLVGASIRVTGTQIGAQTGDDGRFIVRGVRPGTVDLQVNRIGYEVKHASATVVAGETAVVNVTLAQAAFSLAEVVTTVTGTQSKAEISNTVATIDVASKIPEAAITSTGQLLSGRASGVQVLSSGTVGSGSRIRIRGQSSLSLSNDPIVYVDGVRVDAGSSNVIGTGGTQESALDNINPEEIETIDVIKGPAAATLYGTQAANGVILITTKKGHVGATHYNFFSENGAISNPVKGHYLDLWGALDMSGAAPKSCTLITQLAGSCHIDTLFHHNVLNDPVTTPLSTGNRQQYGGQISGGAEKLQYFISGDMEHEQGPYKMPAIEINRLSTERGSTVGSDQIYPNALKRVNLRTNLSSQFTSKSDLNLSIGYADSYIRQPQNEDNSDGLMVDALGGPARTDLLDVRKVPLLGYRSFPMGDIFAQRNSQSVNRFINGLNARYYPTAWLNVRANVGYDYSSRNETFLQEYNQGPFNDSNRNATTNGFVQNVRSENAVYTADGGLTATWAPLQRWNAKTSFGVQYFRNWASRTQGTGQNLPPGATTTSAGAIRASTQNTAETINLGGYGEEVLSYADRIFITGGLRYDGNSAFGSNFSGVFYPKIGASWLLSDESFFPKFSQLNSFRLRATYGSSGVQPGTADALRYFSPVGASILGSEQSAVTLGSLGNATLKPEYSGEFESGFDLTAFQNATTLEFTYYNKKTKDALISAPTAPSIGGTITSQLMNLGSTRNQGLELTLNQKVIDNNEVGVEFQLTGSTNKNRILALGENITPIFTGNRSTQYNAPGYPLFGLWGKQISYADKNGDGILAVNEVSVSDTAVYWGPSFPTHEFAFSPRLELLHRKLAFSAQFDHKDGMTKFFNTLRHQCQGGASCEGLYDKDAGLARQAAAVAVNNYATYTGMYYNGEFTRLREVAVSYQLPDGLAQRIRASRATIIGTGRNLHVWTPYPGSDPEATVGNADARGNEEYFSTPPLRYFTLRLTLNF
jgi:TonB-linked SusC/RagA family outer membrane protein